jgi:Uma2 family endonuclease
MTTTPLKKHATYDDLRDVPDHFVAEMLDGELYATPRPAVPHAHASSALGATLFASFHRSGAGGWVILDEPELHFGDDVLVPDIAGWRRERLPTVPATNFLTIAPDWVCEVLSASTESLDRGEKLRIYAREGVAHVWLVDPQRRTLEVLSLASRESGRWTAQSTHEGCSCLRAAPFESVELDLAQLWI